LKLFPEVAHTHKYSVNVYRTSPQAQVSFSQIANLFQPSTVDHCFSQDGLGTVPGIRDSDDRWEVRGHLNRIVETNESRLGLFASLYDETGTHAREARLPQVHSSEIVQVLESFSTQVRKLGDLSDQFLVTKCWDETFARSDGTIRRDTRYPKNLEEWVFSGPHFYVASPFNKTPNENCRSHGDYSDIDLVSMPDSCLPRTNYVRACSLSEYNARLPTWKGKRFTDYYRQFFRAMLNPVIERTLIGCIAPPQVTHINAVQSYTFDHLDLLVEFSGLSSSILLYLWVVKSHDTPSCNSGAELPHCRWTVRL
jgi:hypothetical protein